MRSAIPLLCLLAAACSDSTPGRVDLSVYFDGAVSDAALAMVSVLRVSATGDETYQHDLLLGRAAQRNERVVYRTLPRTESLQITLEALDSTQSIVAVGTTPLLMLVPGGTLAAAVSLAPACPTTDGSCGADMAIPDLAPSDLTAIDLAHLDASGDAAMPAPGVFTVTSPVNGAMVSGAFVITGEAGSSWKNVAANNDATNMKVSTDDAPVDGMYSITVNSLQFPNGPALLDVDAYTVPAETIGGTKIGIQLAVSVQN